MNRLTISIYIYTLHVYICIHWWTWFLLIDVDLAVGGLAVGVPRNAESHATYIRWRGVWWSLTSSEHVMHRKTSGCFAVSTEPSTKANRSYIWSFLYMDEMRLLILFTSSASGLRKDGDKWYASGFRISFFFPFLLHSFPEMFYLRFLSLLSLPSCLIVPMKYWSSILY